MTIQERVKHLLETTPHLRDGLKQLCCRIWIDELTAMGFGSEMFLILYEHGKLTSEGTILRLWRLILADDKNKHLRGELWQSRHQKAEIIKHEIVRGDLKTLLA